LPVYMEGQNETRGVTKVCFVGGKPKEKKFVGGGPEMDRCWE